MPENLSEEYGQELSRNQPLPDELSEADKIDLVQKANDFNDLVGLMADFRLMPPDYSPDDLMRDFNRFREMEGSNMEYWLEDLFPADYGIHKKARDLFERDNGGKIGQA